MGGSGVRADSGGVPGRFRWRRLAMVSAMVLGLAGVVACGDGASTEVTATAPDAGAAPSPAGESSWRAASETRVYFAWNEKVGAAGRSSSPATPEGAIEALLKGPDAFETDIGMTSAIPDATKLLGRHGVGRPLRRVPDRRRQPVDAAPGRPGGFHRNAVR